MLGVVGRACPSLRVALDRTRTTIPNNSARLVTIRAATTHTHIRRHSHYKGALYTPALLKSRRESGSGLEPACVFIGYVCMIGW